MSTATLSPAKAVQTAGSGWVVVCREAGHAIHADLGRTRAYVLARTAECPECERRATIAAAEAADAALLANSSEMRNGIAEVKVPGETGHGAYVPVKSPRGRQVIIDRERAAAAPDMSEVFEAEAMRDEAEENGDPIAAALADVALAVALGDKPARNAAIIRAREAGASVDDLATAANIVTSTVYDVLRGSSAPSGGVSTLREYQKGYQEALADILALTDAGKTRDESLLMIEEWISNNRLAAAASIFARRALEG
ncbi:hypothetical protein [Microbacterium phage MO526]|uniref:Helix-turn-helix DNA binding domain protein n=1 Tax=Microbacterium phage MO526 TaxID=3108092 RepID=A0ABZ0ZXE9_9CAUD|nr:hypothetical protein [Microbacterium phage MO526]